MKYIRISSMGRGSNNYYCTKCHRDHVIYSKIGKLHRKYSGYVPEYAAGRTHEDYEKQFERYLGNPVAKRRGTSLIPLVVIGGLVWWLAKRNTV